MKAGLVNLFLTQGEYQKTIKINFKKSRIRRFSEFFERNNHRFLFCALVIQSLIFIIGFIYGSKP